MSDTNEATLRYSRETVWGETPATPGATNLRLTSESLGHEKQTVTSQEVRSDRQRADILEVGQSASGDINFEMIYGEYESFFEALMGASTATTSVSGEELNFAASTITASTTSSTVWGSYNVGQWIRVTGASAANNNVVRVEAIASSILTFTGATGSAQETSSATVNGRRITDGTSEFSYFLEAAFSDITAVKYFTGMEVSQMSMTAAANQVITGVFSFIGERGFAASVTVASVVITSATTNTPMTATANVGLIRENDATLGDNVQDFAIQVNGNLRSQPAVGNAAPVGVGQGGFDITGSMTVYFDNITLYNKFINHTTSSLEIKLSDASGNVIMISIPAIKYTGGNPVISGQDADVFLPLEFAAFRDSATGRVMTIDMLPATP